MVKVKDRDLYILYKSILEYKNLLYDQPIFEGKWLLAKYNQLSIKKYYEIKKQVNILSKKHLGLKVFLKRLPQNAWLLRKFRFELLYFFFVLLIFAIYIWKVPIYKGWLTFFLGGAIGIWLILREFLIVKIDCTLKSVILELLEHIKKELNNN
jgi:hypothetical protein